VGWHIPASPSVPNQHRLLPTLAVCKEGLTHAKAIRRSSLPLPRFHIFGETPRTPGTAYPVPISAGIRNAPSAAGEGRYNEGVRSVDRRPERDRTPPPVLP
jgi:hypothetical protein